MATADQLRDEEQRLRRVRVIVDVVSSLIMQRRLSRGDAQRLAGLARGRVLELFPGREDTYDVIYATRFSRLMDEFCCSEPVRSVGPTTVVQFGGSRPS